MDRLDLAAWFGECGFKAGVELGVERGMYSIELLDRIPGVTLYCVDAWTVYRGYREHVTQPKMESLLAETMERLADRDVVVIRGWSTEVAATFEDGSLDFVYIDANHELSHVVNDLTAWVPKVRKGGVVAGHDYIRRTSPHVYQMHVVEAVNAYTEAWGIRPLFIVGTKEMRPEWKRDRPRSWFWVVE